MTRLTDEKTADKLIARHIALWEARRKATREAEAQAKLKKEVTFGPYISFSREEGSQGGYVARAVAEQLGWEVFGKELVDYLSKKTHVRRTVIDSLDEHSRNSVSDWVTHLMDRDFLGPRAYQKHLIEILTTVGHYGHVVFIGRGSNFVLPWDYGLHVRVIAPLEKRVHKVMQDRNLDADSAEKFIRQSDADRAAFVRMYFHKDVAACHHYDLLINTASIPLETAVVLVLQAAKAKLGIKAGK